MFLKPTILSDLATKSVIILYFLTFNGFVEWWVWLQFIITRTITFILRKIIQSKGTTLGIIIVVSDQLIASFHNERVRSQVSDKNVLFKKVVSSSCINCNQIPENHLKLIIECKWISVNEN